MYAERKRTKGLTIVADATLSNIDIICDKTRIFLNEFGLSSIEFQTLISLREALCNAVIHGSNSDYRKKIFFQIKINGKSLIIEIEDQGEGFNWKSINNEIPDSSLESGRGLAIIKHHFGRLRYNKKGNKIILEKFL